MQRIVINDPINDHKQGEIIEGENEIARLMRRRVAMLPIESGTLVHPMAGYVARSWGKGIDLDRNAGTRAAPVVLFVDPKLPFIYWCARVVPIRNDEQARGSLRLVTDGNTGHTLSGGLSSDVVPSFGEKDEGGGWTLYGRGKLSIGMDGWLGLSLYGTLRNARILWSAVSQSSQMVEPSR